MSKYEISMGTGQYLKPGMRIKIRRKKWYAPWRKNRMAFDDEAWLEVWTTKRIERLDIGYNPKEAKWTLLRDGVEVPVSQPAPTTLTTNRSKK